MQVSELTVEELKLIIQETVAEMIESLVPSADEADPDTGKALRPEFVAQLRESFQQTQKGKRGMPLAEAAKELGIDLG